MERNLKEEKVQQLSSPSAFPHSNILCMQMLKQMTPLLQRHDDAVAVFVLYRPPRIRSAFFVNNTLLLSKVERAFDRDWARLCHPVLQPIDK